MKVIYPWCIAASLLFVCSCSEDVIEALKITDSNADYSNTKEVVSITATIPDFVSVSENPNTRTAVTDDNQLVWSVNDTIGIFPNEGFQVAFPMTEGAGQKHANFTGGGWALKPSATYSAYYPLIGQFYLDKSKIPFSLEGQTQVGNSNTNHIGKFDYMIAVNNAVNDQGCVSFGFQHLVEVLHLKITVPDAGTYCKVEVRTSGGFNNEGAFSLQDGVVRPQKAVGVQTLNLEDVTLTEDNKILEVYMVIPPVDLTEETLIAKVFKEDGKTYTAILKSRQYETGGFYNQERAAVADLESTGLPVVSLFTPNGVDITSKDYYLESLMSFVNTDGSETFADSTNLKGRGNSTWGCPKKPYAIKFDKKKSLLNLPEDKSWVLLANYYDATLLRNNLAYYIGEEMCNFGWTPHLQQVDLMLNGQYKGIYQLGEKVKISKKRVNVGDDGFLLEIDARALNEDDARFFTIDHIEQPVNIKDPEVEYDDDNYTFIKNYVISAETALYSSDFLDEEEGYKKYLDIESFVEWYLVNEISKNADACALYSSCYMNLKRGGKLKMGPLWDFDLAFGDYPWADWANKTEGFALKNHGWYCRLFEDPAFVANVKDRFNEIYASRQQIYDHIDANAAKIKAKIYEENKIWGRQTSTSASEEDVKAAYQEKVDYMKTWIETRLTWLNENINAL